VSFAGVLYVLYRWPRKRLEAVLPGERVLGAMRTGLRYVRHSPAVLATLTRSSAFTVFASSLLALLPALARFELGRGPTGYGVLLGFFGAGAVAAAAALPRVRQRLSLEAVVAAAIAIFAGVLLVLAWLRQTALVDLAVFLGGGMWLTLLSTFNASVQSAVPAWVRGRVVSVSILVFFGSVASGSAAWGWVADRFGMTAAFTAAAAGLLAGLLATFRLRLSKATRLDLSPSVHWPAPDVIKRAAPHQGPVVVTVEYEIEPKKLRHFRRVMKRVRRIRKRDGAINWALLANVERPNHYTETFVVESWVEHLRQHERVTVTDRAVLEKARSFHVGKEPPRVTHFIVEPVRG
jgi:MFS family permease